MDERKPNSEEIEEWMKELLPDNAADIGMWQQHPERTSDFSAALVKTERPNTCQLPMDSHVYPKNQSQHQLMQHTSAGCSSTPLINVKREQEQLNVLQQTDRATLQKMLDMNSGVGLERALPRMQAPVLHQSQNLTLADQLKTGNQTQAMFLGPSLQASSESTSQVEMTNPIDWVNSTYHKILQIKEMYLPQFITLHNKMQELRRQETNAEVVNKWDRNRRFIEMTIRLLNISKPELLSTKKERVSQILNEAMRYISQLRPRNPSYMKQTRQVEASGNHIEASQMQQRENHLQFNNAQGCLQQQPLRPGGNMSLPQSSFNSFNVGSSAGVHHKVDASPNVNSYPYNNLMRPTQQWAPRKVGSQTGGFDPRALRMLLHPPGGVSQYNSLGASQQTVSSSRNIFNPLGNYSVNPIAQTPVSMPPLQNSQQDQVMKRQKMKQPVQQLMNEKNMQQQQQMLQKRNEDTNLRRFVGINQKWSPVPPSNSSSYAMSPQNSQQSSPQLELKELSSMFPRSATPSLSSASPSALPSPLTPLTPLTPMTPLTPSSIPADSVMSPLLEESSKLAKNPVAVSQPPSQETNRNQLATDAQKSMKSCLHKESASFGDKQSSKAKEDPLKRLVEVVKSVSSKALNATSRDIDAVTSLNDRIAGHIVFGKPTKVIVHDLAYDIFSSCDEGASSLEHSTVVQLGMKRQLDTMASDDFATDTEFYASASIKRLKSNNLLLEEIKEINKKLIEVVVDVMTVEDVSRSGSDEGTIIRCSYIPVGFSGNIKIPNTSKLMFPNLLLEFIVSADYPNSSPTVLEKVPSGFCDADEGKYMWMKAKTNFILSLRKLSHPLSVKDMAEAWDVCARKVFHELVDQMGGGSFSSTYGKWENCAVVV